MPDFTSGPMSSPGMPSAPGSAPSAPESPILGDMSPLLSGDTDRKVALANALYEDAMKMQRDAQELLQTLKGQAEPEEPMQTEAPEQSPTIQPMSAPAAQAANSALIGGGFPGR